MLSTSNWMSNTLMRMLFRNQRSGEDFAFHLIVSSSGRDSLPASTIESLSDVLFLQAAHLLLHLSLMTTIDLSHKSGSWKDFNRKRHDSCEMRQVIKCTIYALIINVISSSVEFLPVTSFKPTVAIATLSSENCLPREFSKL